METGVACSQAADLLEDHAKSWGDPQQRKFVILRALCQLTRSNPDIATAGFTANEIWAEVNKVTTWLPFILEQGGPPSLSKTVRTEFKALRTLNLERRENLSRVALAGGHNWWPAIESATGGGATNQTRYRIEARPIDEMTRAAVSSRAPALPGEVQYRPDVTIRLGFYLRWIESGLTLEGARRVGFLLFGGVLLFVFLVIAAFGALAVATGQPIASVLIVVAGTGFIIYVELLPLYRVISTRIIKAPTLIQGMDTGLLLEWRARPRYPYAELHVVRYLGDCPLCAGIIHVDERHWWGPADDLIGRCENAPRLHRFTFDNELKIGTRITPR